MAVAKVPSKQLGSSETSIILENVPCEAAAAQGDIMRMTGPGVAYRALADSVTNSNVIGVIETKASATVCNIRVAGLTLGVYSGLDVTKEYFLSDTTPGAITTTPPTAPGHVRLPLGKPYSTTKFVLMVGERVIRT